MTLYAPNGTIISGEAAGVRRGSQVDAFEVKAKQNMRVSFDLHNRIKNDTMLRERIAQADKEQLAFLTRQWYANGCHGSRPVMQETLHLSVLRHDKKAPTKEIEKGIVNNMKFGEQITNKRRAA